jgi:hypothetical protein
MRFLVRAGSREEPRSEILDSLQTVAVVAVVRTRKPLVLRPRRHEHTDVVEAVGEPSRQLLRTFVLPARGAHRHLEPSERDPVPHEFDPEPQQEAALASLKLFPEGRIIRHPQHDAKPCGPDGESLGPSEGRVVNGETTSSRRTRRGDGGGLVSGAMINDRRDQMTLAELVEELELAHPEKVAGFERRHPDAMAAVADDDLTACEPEELDELASDLRNLLRI